MDYKSNIGELKNLRPPSNTLARKTQERTHASDQEQKEEVGKFKDKLLSETRKHKDMPTSCAVFTPLPPP